MPPKKNTFSRLKQVNYRLPRDLIKQVHAHAQTRVGAEGGHPNASRIVREALEAYLQNLDPRTGFPSDATARRNIQWLVNFEGRIPEICPPLLLRGRG